MSSSAPNVDGFLDHFKGWIDGEENPAHPGGGVARHEAHLVPVLGEGFRPELFDGQQDHAQGGGPGHFRGSVAGSVASFGRAS